MTEQGLELQQQQQQRRPPQEKPSEVIERAREQAKELSKIIEQSGLVVNISGKRYLRFEAWQTLGMFNGITPYVEWTRDIQEADKTIGYECRALALRNGETISSAESQCTNSEANWRGKDLWQIRSMAQTRGCGKALRNVLSWIVVLAGYEPTPAEEMEQTEETKQEKTVYTHCPVHDVKWIRKGNDLIHKQGDGWCNARQVVYQAIKEKADSNKIDEARTYEWIWNEYGAQLGKLPHEKMLEVYERLDEAPKPSDTGTTEEQKIGEEQGRML